MNFFFFVLNFLHLFFTAVQLQNYFYVHCQSYDRNLLIWTYTRNIIIYLQIIYPCIFNQSINPVSFILTSPSYNFDISFLSRLRCSYSRTSPPPTVDIKVNICLRKFQCRLWLDRTEISCSGVHSVLEILTKSGHFIQRLKLVKNSERLKSVNNLLIFINLKSSIQPGYLFQK